MKPLEKLFWDEMAEMLHAREMLLKALHRMNSATTRPSLKEALDAYRADVQDQSEKLRSVFQAYEMVAREKKCDGMMGILLKGQQIIQRTSAGAALDAALLSVCRKITSYNLACYGSLFSWAKMLTNSEKDCVATLRRLTRSEMDAGLRFSRLEAECDQDGANQTVVQASAGNSARKAVKEFAAAPRWADW